MEIIDKIGGTIASVCGDATQKAKDLSELAKIRMDIHSKQDYISKLYQEIGKSYYEKHKNDEEPKYGQVLLIKEAEDVIDELKEQLSMIKGTQKCPRCDNEMPIDADFCSKCGTKLNVVVEESDD